MQLYWLYFVSTCVIVQIIQGGTGEMEQRDILENLKKLDAYEWIGKEYFEETGKELEYEKFLYLLVHYTPSMTLRALSAPSARAKQRALSAQFHENYYKNNFLSNDFFPEGMNLTVEKLPRYISIPCHAHDFPEFVCVLDGTCRHIVDGSEFVQEKGSIAFISSMVSHELHAREDCVCLTIKIRRPVFQDFKLPNLADYVVPIMFQCGTDPFFCQTLLFLWQQQEVSLPYQDQLMNLLFESLLLYVAQNYRHTMRRLLVSPLLDEKMMAILDYMMENYRTVTLNSLAHRFHYNESYLSRMFREKLGETFSQVLRKYRLSQSARLLRETDLNLAGICEAVGYQDTAQFIHSFKDMYQTTPMRYRKNSLNSSM